MNSHIPGLPIEFSIDGGITWKKDSKVLNVKNVLMRTR